MMIGRPAGSRGGLNLPWTGAGRVVLQLAGRARLVAISSSISVSEGRLAGPGVGQVTGVDRAVRERVCAGPNESVPVQPRAAAAGEPTAATTRSAGRCRATAWTMTARAASSARWRGPEMPMAPLRRGSATTGTGSTAPIPPTARDASSHASGADHRPSSGSSRVLRDGSSPEAEPDSQDPGPRDPPRPQQGR